MRYYTFEMDGRKIGYYEESNENGVLASNARMAMQGDIYENSFGVRHSAGKVTAYRYGDSDWKVFKEKADVYPTSALSLIVPLVQETGQFSYTRFIEGKGKVGQQAILKTEDKGVVVEYVGGHRMRHVIIKNGVIVEYGWGGTAKSVLCQSKEEAVKDTRWE